MSGEESVVKKHHKKSKKSKHHHSDNKEEEEECARTHENSPVEANETAEDSHTKSKKHKKSKKSKHSDAETAIELLPETIESSIIDIKHKKIKKRKSSQGEDSDEQVNEEQIKQSEEKTLLPEVHTANSWEKADLGDDHRKLKFLKLMGATKVNFSIITLIGNKLQNPSIFDKILASSDIIRNSLLQFLKTI